MSTATVSAPTRQARQATPQVLAECGHLHDVDDVNTCHANGTEQFGAGRCYDAHAAECPDCNRGDIDDYDGGLWP